MEEKRNKYNKISIQTPTLKELTQWSQFSISSLILFETENG